MKRNEAKKNQDAAMLPPTGPTPARCCVDQPAEELFPENNLGTGVKANNQKVKLS